MWNVEWLKDTKQKANLISDNREKGQFSYFDILGFDIWKAERRPASHSSRRLTPEGSADLICFL